MINLKFNKEQIKKVIEQYYKEQLDFEGKVKINAHRGSVGYGMNEHEDCVVDIILKGQMEFMGEVIPMEKELYEDDIKEVFKYCVEKQGLKFKRIYFDKDITYEGYYEDIKKYIFNGIEVEVEGFQKNKGGIKNGN